jgi:hypothetical protein
LRKIIRAIFACAFSFNCYGVQLGGELKSQQLFAHTDSDSLQSALGAQTYFWNRSTFRLLLDHQQAAWSIDFDYILAVDYSDELEQAGLLNESVTSGNNWFDLEKTISDSNSIHLEHRLDRASVKYSAEQWVMQLGRQAITWGNGIAFHPMDILNPFSPAAKDTSYKAGVDAFYAQYLLENGSDLQLLWVPRSEPFDDTLTQVSDSVAIKYLTFLNNLQLDFLLAEDYQQKVLGLGVVGPVGDAIWKLDLVANERVANKDALSIDLNLSYSWMWNEKPVSGFVEYYRNGFVENSVESLTQFSPELIARLQRGQLFSAGKDNLVVGVQVQWAPLLIVSASLISQLNDHSRLMFANAIYNSSVSSNLIAGIQWASGRDGSEYGGYYIDESNQLIAQPANQIYFRYEWYF